MKIKDTNSIAYIFNEMDPSEEVEFERELNSDNNLLIEVETLKSTKDRLRKLPRISPPDDVVQRVRMMAAEKSEASRKRKQYSVYSAAAALLAMAFMSGLFLYDEPVSEDTPEQQAAMGSSQSLHQIVTPVEQNQNEELTPWVDHNEVIRFTDQFRPDNATYDTVFKHSLQKLTPVTDPIQTRVYQRDLQLTGSN